MVVIGQKQSVKLLLQSGHLHSRTQHTILLLRYIYLNLRKEVLTVCLSRIFIEA